MVVKGQELASLDFANLIGGPLNAVVESQAKAAITTVNFIKEVAFDDKNVVRTVKFGYSRKNDDDELEEFELSVPFLTMLPIPYITVTNALVEFNAKITSVNANEVNDDFKTEVDAGGKVGYWFASAHLQTKTSYQRKTASSEKEERTFDMHVKVEAKNQDMPAGTERLLTILENSISEKKTRAAPPKQSAKAKYTGTLDKDINGSTIEVTIQGTCTQIKKGSKITCDSETCTTAKDATVSGNKLTIELESSPTPTTTKWTANAGVTIEEN